jgi:AraC family transcriptional regulator, regulatory protein of adaptative response / methylated-DNA-[protein]-cysteine methyltransferase
VAAERVKHEALLPGFRKPAFTGGACISVRLEVAPRGTRTGGPSALRYGRARTPFGICLIAMEARGICHVSFLDTPAHESALAELRKFWPDARLERDDGTAQAVALRVFGGERGRSQNGAQLLAYARGTAFQVRVWQALLAVPPAMQTTYRDIATAIGIPLAARAVGAALASNRLAGIVPCHRAVRRDGAYGGYRWGIARKRALLAWEIEGGGAALAREAQFAGSAGGHTGRRACRPRAAGAQ